jgi:hypothetical protein
MAFKDMVELSQKSEDMEQINTELVNKFKAQAQAMGLTKEETIEALKNMGLMGDEVEKMKEELQDVKNALNKAMSAAIENESFLEFSKTMGQAIYDNAKEGLIKAFMESQVYQEMFSSLFECQDINFTGNLEEDFGTIQEIMDTLYGNLKEAGMDFKSTVVPSAEEAVDTINSDDYYSGTEGAKVTNNHYHFSPEIANLYGDTKQDLYQEFLKWLDEQQDNEA